MGFGGYLQANTAVDVLIGPFVDDTDGKTAETGLTLSQGDIKLSKNGQALAQKNDDTAAAADANGYYNCELDATDTNTEGTLTLIVHESGALPVRMDFMVLAQAAYISLVTAKDSGFMDVNVKAVSEDTAAADNLEAACDGGSYNVGGGAVVSASVTGAVGSVTGAVGSVTGAVGSVTGNVGGNVSGSVGSVSGAVGSVTGNVGGSVASVTAGVTLADDAITAAKFDESTAFPLKSADTGATAVARTGADSDTLETLSDQLDDVPTVAEFEARTIAAADYTIVSDLGTVQTADHTASIAAILEDTATTIPGLISALNNLSAAQVWDLASALTLDFGTLMERVYQFLNNKQVGTDATGAIALRDIADSGDIATWGVTDNDTLTVKTGATWA